METITQRDKFVAKLLNGPCTVVFNKVDGTARRMRCTLNPNLIPEDQIGPDDATRSRKVNEEVIPCFDIELQAWRSFRVDSVVDFTPVIENTND